MTRNIMDIVREGQEKELLVLPLKEKQLTGTLTQEEAVRLAMLEGNLLALVKETQALGYGLAPTPIAEEVEDEGEDYGFDLEDEDEVGTGDATGFSW